MLNGGEGRTRNQHFQNTSTTDHSIDILLYPINMAFIDMAYLPLSLTVLLVLPLALVSTDSDQYWRASFLIKHH